MQPRTLGAILILLSGCQGDGPITLGERQAAAQPHGRHGPSARMGAQHGMGMHQGVGGSASLGSDAFVSASACASCHDHIRDAAGNDVSLQRDWAATMMANATRDPFWRAKVRSELTRSPALAEQIADECTRCHAPVANVQAHAMNLPVRIFDDGFLDPDNANHAAALEGVSCTLCHRIADAPSLGKPESFTGGYVLTSERVLYGPYPDPFAMPMQHMVGFTPAYGPQIQRSELCATCHNLKTPVTDAAGRIVRSGPQDGFPEQMPYTEWLASDFATAQSCQDCHMGRTDGVVIASRPPRHLIARDGFALHGFAGGNRLMLELLQANRDELGVPATVDFSNVLVATDRVLSNAAALELVSLEVRRGAVEARLRIRNLAGHKLPTSFPSRRVFVHFTATDERGRVLFESGRPRPDGSVSGDDADLAPGLRFEPHYEWIDDPDQVQIYESVMGDLDGRVTYTLLRAASYLKDNRVLPRGADKAALPADIAVGGRARTDADFLGGSDELTYRLPGVEPGARVQVRAVLHYQSIAAPFARDLFTEGHAEGQRFQRMFEGAREKTFTLAETAGSIVVPR